MAATARKAPAKKAAPRKTKAARPVHPDDPVPCPHEQLEPQLIEPGILHRVRCVLCGNTWSTYIVGQIPGGPEAVGHPAYMTTRGKVEAHETRKSAIAKLSADDG